MDLGQLRTFQMVARTLHFTRAAEKLNLSQPAVSHHIKSLENELSTVLFIRGSHGISLTRSGEVMLEQAERILDISREIEVEIQNTRGNPRGNITIGAVSRFLSNPFPELYLRFKKAYPDVQLRFHNERDEEQLLDGIRSRRLDFGFVIGEPDSREFCIIPYGKFGLLCVAGAGHEFADIVNPGLSTVRNANWALFERGNEIRTIADSIFVKAGLTPKSVYSTNDGSVIRDLVAAGEFVSLLPTRGISQELENGKLVHIPIPELEVELDIYCVWLKDASTEAISTYLEFILENELPGISLAKKCGV